MPLACPRATRRAGSSMSSSLVLAALSLLAHTAAFAPAPLASSARGLLRPVCLRTPPSLGLRMVAVEPERAVASKVALVSLGCPKNVVDAEVVPLPPPNIPVSSSPPGLRARAPVGMSSSSPPPATAVVLGGGAARGNSCVSSHRPTSRRQAPSHPPPRSDAGAWGSR